MADRLVACAPAGGVVSRLGGDEFAVIHSHRRADMSNLVAAGMLDAITPPITATGENILVTATSGLATFPADAQSGEELLRCADIALYNGKRHERGSVGRYAAGFASLFDMRRMAIEKVERALIGNRLIPF